MTADDMNANDYFAIQNLLNRYFQYVDTADFEACGQLFAKADLMYLPSGKTLSKDPQAVTQQMRDFVKLYGDPQTPRTRHHSGNIIIEPETSRRAHAACSAIIFQATDRLDFQAIAEASYSDILEKDAGKWHFIRRELTLTFAGNLKHHLLQQVTL